MPKTLMGRIAISAWLACSVGGLTTRAVSAGYDRAGNPAEEAGPSRPEPPKIAGPWEMVAVERFGKRLDYIQGTSAPLNNPTITEDKVTVPVYVDPDLVMVAYVVMEYRLRQDRGVHAIDFVNQSDKDLSGVMKGIYSVEGNVLKICLFPHGKNRPTEFSTRPGSDQQLVIMRRRKPAATDPSGKE